MDDLSSTDSLRPEQENPADVERWEAMLDGHLRMIQYLQNIHDAHFAPYCKIFIERIEKGIVPIIEEALVAAKILMATAQPLPKMTVQNLNKRVQDGLDLPAYEGGGFLDP